ncbi:MAG: hypothetical protein R2848_14405 [Thermomicrobiales bacterium]
MSLLDGSGNVVSTASTGGNGSLSFTNLVPGTYSLSSSSGCALFANGADARNGFTIAAGDTVQIAAFGCEETVLRAGRARRAGPEPGFDWRREWQSFRWRRVHRKRRCLGNGGGF